MMQKQTFTFKDEMGEEIFVYKWFPDVKQPKAIVQIAHGAIEHAGRYERFAEVLIKAGYGVYANDHTGHGKTAKVPENVCQIEKNDFSRMVKDMHMLTEIIKTENPGLEVFLFSHSMGSFLAQSYIQNYGDEIKGVVLCATSGKVAIVGVVKFLARMGMIFKGPKAKAQLLNDLQFGGYNKGFAPNRTSCDWLSRDEAEVDQYVQDPFCGNVGSNNFFYAIASGLESLFRPKGLAKVPKNLPIYLISGTRCAVGENTKTVLWLIEKYKEQGIKDITCRLYTDARHELLNETNKDEVMQDVVRWLDAHL